MAKTAIVIGATGLVGRHLTQQLLDDPRYETVRVFVRRSMGLPDEGLDEHIVDFDALADWKDSLRGDELFSAMGTTLKQAGSKQAQWQVDYTYQLECARAAAENGVATLLLVSSSGASAKSVVFYSKMKGQLDEAVMELPFERIGIFRPSLLLGDREKRRTGERAAEFFMTPIRWVPGLRRYRGIEGRTVAGAMVAWANDSSQPKKHIAALDALFTLAANK